MAAIATLTRGILDRLSAGLRTSYLPRDQIIEALDGYIARSHNGTYTGAVILFEIDEFTQLEEMHGSEVVFEIQRELEERILGGPCARDMMRTLGGGRFAVLPTPLSPVTQDRMAALSDVLQRLAARPIARTRGSIYITISIGYAHQSQLDEPSGKALIEAASLALRTAQKEGPASLCPFDPDMLERIKNRESMKRHYQDALTSGAIQAHFQPQVNTVTGEIIGVEALARWDDPERGLVPPGLFLPDLEELGLMRSLGLTVLRDSMNAMRQWQDLGIEIPTVSLNLSTEELRNPNLLTSIQYELDRVGLDPKSLVVEVLESVVTEGANDRILENLDELAKLGCLIDLDDFGTGNASITAIRKFGVDRIKIDRSFVADLVTDSDKRSMVEAMVMMADRLSVKILAEGAETEEELAALADAGCSDVQGYAIAKPMPPHALVDWAHDWRQSNMHQNPRQRYA